MRLDILAVGAFAPSAKIELGAKIRAQICWPINQKSPPSSAAVEPADKLGHRPSEFVSGRLVISALPGACGHLNSGRTSAGGVASE